MIRFSLLFLTLIISQNLFAQDLSAIKDKVFVYEALFIEANGDTLTNEKIEFQFNSTPWSVTNQEEMVHRYFTDTIGIEKYIHPFEKLRKKYQKNQRKREAGKKGWEQWTWLNKNYVTGYVLNDSVFWIHPARTNQYLHNELAGMPTIELQKLSVGGNWQSKVIIMMGWYDFKGTIESAYQVKGKEAYKKKGLSVPDAWKIEVGHSHSNLGQYESSILFDEKQYGFLRFDNSFHDGRRIILSLVEVKNAPKKG